MISTSSAYKTAIRNTVRRIRGKVQITWTAASIDPTITVTSNDDNRGMIGDDGVTATRNAQAADGKTLSSRKWAHLDGTLKPDGTFYPMPSDAQASYSQVGWFGATRCDGSAQWGSPYKMLTITFEKGPIFALSVVGDQIYNEYPVDFDIKIYDESDTLLHTEPITGNSSLTWLKDISDLEIYNAKKMELILKKWSAPNRVAKILEFYSPIVAEYTGDDIISMDLLEEREISDGTLPIGNISSNELDLELQNIGLTGSGGTIIKDPFAYANALSPLNNKLKPNRKIAAWIGAKLPDNTTEWVKLGTFWSGDWKASEKDSKVSTSARDRLEFLRKAEFTESLIYTGITAYDLLEIVLNHAKANVFWLADMTWSIATELDNSIYTIPFAYFPRQSYFECVRQIVEACRAQAYMSRDDILIITGPSFAGTSTGYIITKDDYFNKIQPSKSGELKNLIRMPVSALTERINTGEIYFGPQKYTIAALEEKIITAIYSKTPTVFPIARIESTLTFIIIESAIYYETYAQVTVKNNGSIGGELDLYINSYLQSVYESQTYLLAVSAEITINAEYSSYPVSSPVAILAGASSGIVIDTDHSIYYACHASIVVKNNGVSSGSFKLVINGIAYDKKSDVFKEADDADSQLEFGILKYEYPANHLLQDETMAQTIADDLLAVYKNFRKDVQLNWAGDPSLELGDLIQVPEYQRFSVDKKANFLIFKNQINFDGSLRQITDARKISDA